MQAMLRWLLSLIVAVAFLGGTVCPAFAACFDNCIDAAQAGQSGHHDQSHDQDENSDSCAFCPCCAVVPTLPPVPQIARLPKQIAYVVYTEHSNPLIGRSILPDPSPPRTIA